MAVPSRRSPTSGADDGPIGDPGLAALVSDAAVDLLPPAIASWLAGRGWRLRAHQQALLAKARQRRSTLLIAPTGAGKTLAGFLPSLVELCGIGGRVAGGAGLHTLYVSPLKALAVDVHRNLMQPVSEIGLALRVETRTGDTPVGKRQRQRSKPPEILMTTPEQVALLLTHADSPHLFRDLRFIVLDELHALAASKRGDLLALNLARLSALAPEVMCIGLSATVARPSELRAFLVGQDKPDTARALADLVITGGGASPDIRILESEARVPWAGHTTRYATADIYRLIADHRLSLLFVNTRMQAELLFQELWRINEAGLPIALHHGSLDAGQRRKVEAAMAAGRLRAVVATSTLDLGIDWGDVDLVVNVGAPKGASRLIQRVGRSNHRLDEPSKAVLVPSNLFEVLECVAAREAAAAGVQDATLNRDGALDVLAQHVMSTALAGPFDPARLFAEVRGTAPYAGLDRATFDRVVDLASTGGYALRAYERFARLRPTGDGCLRLAHPRLANQHRLNIGTIVEGPTIKVRLVGRKGAAAAARAGRPRIAQGGRLLGELDEWYASELVPGDTFAFAGEILRFETLRENEALVTRATGTDPKVPSYPGGKFPLSTHLATRVRALLATPSRWTELPAPVGEWLALQADRSMLPGQEDVLIETFPHAGRFHLVAYPFEGRLAHQTLGMLLTRRLHRARCRPLGFIANDYGLAIWCLGDLHQRIGSGTLELRELLDEDMLGDDLEAWLAESNLLRRTFRFAAIIAGLIERRHPGREKTGRQLTVSADLMYDVLRRHDPGHILLEAAWRDAATGLLDIGRLGDFLRRVAGRIRHQILARVSPLAVPILLEIGREWVRAGTPDQLLRDAAEALIREANGGSLEPASV